MTVHSARSTDESGNGFPYEELLAFFRQDLRDAAACRRIGQLVQTDPRWRAHWESIQHLDLERAAAIQDGKDLREFQARGADAFCKAVAQTDGKIFELHLVGRSERHPLDRWTRKEWDRKVARCVYCRRMRRETYASGQRREGGLPAGEPLLREWLLRDYYADALEEVTQAIRRSITGQALKIVVRGGRFSEISNGKSRPLGNYPEGRFGGWTYHIIPAAPPIELNGPLYPESALLDDRSAVKLRMELELERELSCDLGRLQLILRVDQNDEVACEAALIRPKEESQPRRELLLRIECQDIKLIEVSGDEQVLRGRASLPPAQFLAGHEIRVCVSEAGRKDAPLLEDFAIQFKE